jgi:hypothetical protein
MAELFPPPPAAPADAEKKAEEDAASVSDAQRYNPNFQGGRGRGNVFLVSRKTGNVIWAIHQPPKNSTPREMEETARRVTREILRSLGKK